MEDIGAQVATPIFIHQPLVGRFCEPHSMAKKRTLSYQATNYSQHQQLNRSDNWNPNAWNWDSMRFVAKPMESDSIRMSTNAIAVQSELQWRGERQINVVNPSKTSHTGQDEESLSLKLGGLTSAVEPAARPSKRVRSGSPGVSSYPMCQVDNCKEDLSNAKDYHRRHKVCELHSKATKALVGKQMQRFCQQCSRFHTLPEFDEGKRSCRRRLAGHNRRRRKTQPEDATSRVLLPGNRESTGNTDMDIVNLLAVLARAQGSTEERGTNFSAVPDKDQLLQILSKLNSLPLPANLVEKISGSSDKSFSNQASSRAQSSLNGNTSSPSTRDLLAALTETPAGRATDIQSEGSSHGSDSEKSKSSCMDQATCLNLHNGLALELPSVGGARSSTSNHSPVEDSDSHMQELHGNLPLQLFSSSPEIDSIPKLAADRKYFSSGSSNPSVDRSPSSSPPVTQKLFPMPTLREKVKPGITNTANVRGNAYVTSTRATGITSLQLFGGSTTGADNGSSQSSPYQAGYTSSSGSDHSPSSLNSDAQDRTGRIIFKLFDKDPSQLPGTLRAQIYNWLSNSPSDIEGYIRPGCIVLSVYVSMSSSAWDQLEENLYQCVKSLVDDIDCDFWRDGRFLVHTRKQLASHKSGKIRLCKSWRVWSSPELISVSPIAVVSGQETCLLLKGRNLTVPGTRISCTHTAGYTMKQLPGPACEQQTTYDEISLGSFSVCGADTSALGRCFIEVENGFRGASFPVIIADAAVCQELRLLEFEIGGGAKLRGVITANDVQDSSTPSSREETLHFLNELGWLFQRKRNLFLLETPDYKLGRFKFLFVFSIEHDFCALVKTLLDILLEINLARDELSGETLEMLSEIHLLNRAVKRRCKNMVNLLLRYSVLDDCNASTYIFPPNLVGPGGITPLHLAASMSNSDDLVDALTSDPQEIALHCWNSLLDSNGLSPCAYASMRNNHSYNRLVAQKVADKENLQISVTIGDEIELVELGKDHKQRSAMVSQGQSSCSKCVIAAARYGTRIPGSKGLLQRPYIHSMLAIAAVCVCVCLLFRGAPDIGSVAPFKWEKLDFGTL